MGVEPLIFLGAHGGQVADPLIEARWRRGGSPRPVSVGYAVSALLPGLRCASLWWQLRLRNTPAD